LIRPVVANFLVDARSASIPTGARLDTVFPTTWVPPVLGGPVARTPAAIELGAVNPLRGDVRVLARSNVLTDAKGSITLSSQHGIVVQGALEARGGAINLLIRKVANDDNPGGAFDPTQSIWVGAGSTLSVAGTLLTYTDARGVKHGDVLP